MKDEEIARINELAQIKRTRALTQEEERERKELHSRYIADMRASLQSHLDHLHVQEVDGTIRPLRRKDSLLH